MLHSGVARTSSNPGAGYRCRRPVRALGTTYSLQSEALGEQRRIFVSLPPDYESSTRRYPVVYLLDAQTFPIFQYAYGEVSALAALGEMPQVILVGVPSQSRELDMTAASRTNEGRADAFLGFFRNELQVFIDAQFRTEPYAILIGHSLGEVFAMHVLARALRALGRAEESLAAFENAVAAGTGSGNYEMFVRDRDQVAQELNK